MPSVFREPPLFSRVTLMSAAVAAARASGRSLEFLSRVMGRAHAPARKAAMFADYTPGPEDLFVATYPKSGTNWAMQLCLQTAWRGRAEFAHVHEVVPWPESPFPGVASLHDPGWRSAPHPTHVIKCAFELRYLPVDSPARFLGVLRDPKDVMVSSYWFITGIFGMTDLVSPDEWVDWVLSPEMPFSPWADHAADLWAHRARDNVEVLLFHEMKRDLPGALRRVESLIGLTLTDEERAIVLERSGFPWMRAHEDRFGPPRLRFRPGPGARMLRRGASGGSDELLSPAQQARIDTVMRQRLAELGSDLPFDELFGTSS